jgi:hypothetical protein
MNKKIIVILIIFCVIPIYALLAQNTLSQTLAGYILLQVESSGEAWYVNPGDQKKYFLNRPDDAFEIMRSLGVGISNENLSKIPIGNISYDDQDNDQDGLVNRFEIALGTDPENADTDNDGYNDRVEIENYYDPNSSSTLPIDEQYTKSHLGKIFLQIEQNGEAWYLYPKDQKRYYLGRPSDAFVVMKKLSLGITNENINNIPIGDLSPPPPPETPTTSEPECQNCDKKTASLSISNAARAIRANNKKEAITFFTKDLHKAIEFTLDYLDSEQRLLFGNMLSGAKQKNSSADEVIFTIDVYFSLGGYKVPVDFHLEKQEDDTWLISKI